VPRSLVSGLSWLVGRGQVRDSPPGLWLVRRGRWGWGVGQGEFPDSPAPPSLVGRGLARLVVTVRVTVGECLGHAGGGHLHDTAGLVGLRPVRQRGGETLERPPPVGGPVPRGEQGQHLLLGIGRRSDPRPYRWEARR
jgi:hypothetical protein